MITSSSNAKVKNIIALQKKSRERKAQGLFVVEGRKLVGEVPAGWISELYVSESYAAGEAGIYAEPLAQQDGMYHGISDVRCEVLSDELFEKVSDTRTPQGILALVKMPSYDFSDLMGVGHQPLLLILEDIQDPGNLGTILRTAEGAGVTGVIMSRGTADIYNPKVVRSTMGSIYRVPFVVADDLQEMVLKLKDAGVKLYAAHLQGASDYDSFDYSEPTGFMIGNEANGLTDETALLADAYIRIPMCGQVESLNAAVSAALLSYEAARQRRHGSRF